MRRIFAIEWSDELGEDLMDLESLDTFVRTQKHIKSDVEIKIEEVTNDGELKADEPIDTSEPVQVSLDAKDNTETLRSKPAEEEEVKEKCGICRFRLSSKCHKNPPTVIVESGTKQYLNPGVTDDGWCGGFAPVLTTKP